MLYLTRPRNSVYIMRSPAHPGKIKIGVSNAPQLRAKQVGRKGKGKQPARVDVAFEIGMPGAYQVEAFLHRLYKPLNSPTSGDGRTEWFSCFPLICLALAIYAAWFALYRRETVSESLIFAHIAGIVMGCYLAFVVITAAVLMLARFVIEVLPALFFLFLIWAWLAV